MTDIQTDGERNTDKNNSVAAESGTAVQTKTDAGAGDGRTAGMDLFVPEERFIAMRVLKLLYLVFVTVLSGVLTGLFHRLSLGNILSLLFTDVLFSVLLVFYLESGRIHRKDRPDSSEDYIISAGGGPGPGAGAGAVPVSGRKACRRKCVLSIHVRLLPYADAAWRHADCHV